MELKLVALIGIVCVSLSRAADENWCDPTLCEDGLTHTGCEHYLEFAQECGDDPELVVLSTVHKKLILDLHNQHRNKCAGGSLPGYAPAARMPALRWNEDLAYVAGLHARSCTTENDGCRNTRIFRNVGQNIGYDSSPDSLNNVTVVVKRNIEAWQGEHKFGNQNNLKVLTPETVISMGRFTMMMNDRTSDVGCALVRFTKDGLYHAYFTCNYGANNRLDQHVYETGTPCSNCATGCNRIWTHLCSADEKIDTNHYHVDNLKSFN